MNRLASTAACVGLYAAAFTLLTGCATSVSEQATTAPSPQTAASQPAPFTPALPDNAVAGNPGKDFLLTQMTKDLDGVWNTDTAAGHKTMCGIWEREPDTILGTLAADNGTATPVGVTIEDIRAHLTDYFNGKCDNLGS